MHPDAMDVALRQRCEALASLLDERQRRWWAAAEAQALGYGGVSRVARLTGVSRRAIHAGLRELAEPPGRSGVRRPGGGRKRLTQTQPGLAAALEALVEPTCRGDPARRCGIRA